MVDDDEIAAVSPLKRTRWRPSEVSRHEVALVNIGPVALTPIWRGGLRALELHSRLRHPRL